MFQIYNIIQRGYFGEYKQTIYTINFYVGITTISLFFFFIFFQSYHHQPSFLSVHSDLFSSCKFVNLCFFSWFMSVNLCVHFGCLLWCSYSCRCECVVVVFLLCECVVDGECVNDLQCVSFAIILLHRGRERERERVAWGGWTWMMVFELLSKYFCVYPSHAAVCLFACCCFCSQWFSLFSPHVCVCVFFPLFLLFFFLCFV